MCQYSFLRAHYTLHNRDLVLWHKWNIRKFLTLSCILSQWVIIEFFGPYFQISRLEYYFVSPFLFLSCFPGHLSSDFVILWFSCSFLQLGVGGPEKQTRNVQESRTRKESWKLHNLSLVDFQNWTRIVKLSPNADSSNPFT